MVEGKAAWGTTPVRPYDPRGPVGMIQADGFQAPVGAVLLDEEKEGLLLVSLAGPRTTVAAIFAKLLQGQRVFFSSTSSTMADRWLHTSGRYREVAVPLAGCRRGRGAVAVLFSHAIDLQEVCSRPPTFPEQASSPQTSKEQPSSSERLAPLAPVLGNAILLGNQGESRPALSTFLRFLRATRAILPSGELLEQWAEVLWEAGVQDGLIQPLPAAAGICGWKLVGQALEWNELILRHQAKLYWPN